MAERSGPSRIVAYTVPRLEKTPLDLEVTTVSTGTGSVLDAASLAAGSAVVDENVPFVSQRFVTVEEPSGADDITLQAGSTLRRTDVQGETGLRSATVDRVTLDRVTSMPVENPIGTIQVQADEPAEEVPHTGLQYKFPFGAEQKSYPYFDINARVSQDIDFVEETEINGTPVYKYEQTIAPVDLSSVVNIPTNRVTLPAATWGVEGGETPVTMTPARCGSNPRPASSSRAMSSSTSTTRARQATPRSTSCGFRSPSTRTPSSTSCSRPVTAWTRFRCSGAPSR